MKMFICCYCPEYGGDALACAKAIACGTRTPCGCDCHKADGDPDIIRQLAVRYAAASEVLGHLATKGGANAEVVRLRAAFERIVEGGDAVGIAEEALRWK